MLDIFDAKSVISNPGNWVNTDVFCVAHLAEELTGFRPQDHGINQFPSQSGLTSTSIVDYIRDAKHGWLGGTPDASNPKRHFLAKNGAELSISYVKMTMGKVDTASSSTSEHNAGGSIFVSGANTKLSVLGVLFEGCGESINCARRGGAVYAETQAQVSINASTFISCNADQEGGAVAAIGGAKVVIQNTKFKKNNAGQYGGAIYVALSVGTVVVGVSCRNKTKRSARSTGLTHGKYGI